MGYATSILSRRLFVMPTTCSIPICPSQHGDSVSYHRFPRDPEVRRTWLALCERNRRHLNPRTSRVCSEHFCSADFERDLRNELLGLPVRRILKSQAVPTLRLGAPEGADAALSWSEDKKGSSDPAQPNMKPIEEQVDRVVGSTGELDSHPACKNMIWSKAPSSWRPSIWITSKGKDPDEEPEFHLSPTDLMGVEVVVATSEHERATVVS